MKKRFLKKSKISTKLFCWFLSVALLPLIFFGYVSHRHYIKILKTEVMNKLTTIADTKANQIENYFYEKEKDVNTLAQSPAVIDATKKFIEVFKKGGLDSPSYISTDKELRPFFTYYKEAYNFSDLFLISSDGNAVFSVMKGEDLGSNYYSGIYRNSELAKVFDRAKTLLDTEISDFEYYPATNEPATFIAAPVFKNGAVIGVIVFQMSNEEVYALVQDYTGLGGTGETVIGSKSGNEAVFIAPVRNDSYAAFRKRIAIDSEKALPIQNAVLGKKGSGIAVDYRGKPVLAVWRYLPYLRWGMVVKINEEEAFKQVVHIRNWSLIIGSIAIFSVILIVVLVSKSITGPIIKLTQATKRISAGNILSKIKINSGDEIGILTESFNKMTDGLHKAIVSRDKEITERKQAGEELKASEEKYRILVENANDAIFVVQDGVVKFPNRKTEELTGYSAEELSKMPFVDFIHPDNRAKVVDRHRRRMMGEKPVSTYPFKIINKSGTEKTVQVNTVLIQWEERPATLNFLRDITQQVELESRLSQTQKMEAIGTLAGGIAHDFNNILGIILGYSDILKLDLPSDAPAAKELDQIIKAGNRAKDLVSQILAFSRQSKKELIPIQPNLIINEALKMLRASIPSTIEIRHNIPKCGYIIGDPTQLHQIMINLCTNAYHAMRETGGVLEVLLEPVVLDENDTKILSLALPPGSYIKLEISDTGHGIDAAIQQRIFDPYFTTKKKGEGTGLGLSVVHGVVKNFGGHISVYSEPDKGTTFRIYLPQISLEAQTRPDKLTEPIPTGDEHILVVDDEESMAELEKQMLESLEYRVTACTSSPEALKIFQNQPEDFDLVITDMTMPDMTGVELIQRIRMIRPNIPIILCSGFSELINEEKARRMGIRKYLMKPVLKRDLAAAVREMLDEDKRPQ